MTRIAGRWVCTLLAFASLFAVPAQAVVSDFSDLWWNPAESGWGMQLVRGGDVTFATLFVYDGDSRPTFFSATLASSGAAWIGTLYQTSGPSFASAGYDPMDVVTRPVGLLTFTPQTSDSAQVQYTVDLAIVVKNVTRQTLRLDNYSGSFPLATQRVTTHCPDAAANGDRTVLESATFTHAGTVIAIDWNSAQRSCHYAGAYMQAGKLGAAQTAYTCSDGENGDLALFELTKRDGFIAGRFQGHAISNGCDHRGRFAGFVPE